MSAPTLDADRAGTPIPAIAGEASPPRPALANAGTVVISVNDEPRRIGVDATLSSLVAAFGVADRKGVAVAVNGNVVARKAWATHPFADGDRVLIIRASQGG